MTALEANVAGAPTVSRIAAAIRVAVGVALAGVLVGALWAWLAPAIHGVIALTKSGNRVTAYLGNESDNFFLGEFLLVGMLTALTVVAAVLVWQWRPHRGPVLLAALTLGAAGAAGVAAGIGAVLVRWRYGVVDIAAAPVTPEHRIHYVTEAPAVFFGHGVLQIAATILLPAAVAALVYTLAALSTPRDDLGAWPPVEYAGVYPPIPVAVSAAGVGIDPPAAPGTAS
ncbi:MAG: DUF2567 domain-containing protein [Mycolicibacterium cosmeticum]|nr:DUF2567 domain-containing protein [Mycolicibacterium cosmeticum]